MFDSRRGLLEHYRGGWALSFGAWRAARGNMASWRQWPYEGPARRGGAEGCAVDSARGNPLSGRNGKCAMKWITRAEATKTCIISKALCDEGRQGRQGALPLSLAVAWPGVAGRPAGASGPARQQWVCAAVFRYCAPPEVAGNAGHPVSGVAQFAPLIYIQGADCYYCYYYNLVIV